MTTHQFLQFVPPEPRRRIVREIGVALMNRYLNVAPLLSRTRLVKISRRRIPCFSASRDATNRKEWNSKPICVEDIELALEDGEFDFKRFDLFDPSCDWLDPEIVASPQFHLADADGEVLKFVFPTTLGETFPLAPKLDREGTAISSPQRSIQSRIHTLRSRLVENSSKFMEMDWFQDLRSLFAECVSLIDVTLHQLYYKAKYDPLPGWCFDEQRLGPPHGLRLSHKLQWVHKITGRDLNAPKDEQAAFAAIRELRNHLQHFDPPCFCFTLEDAANWLNLVPLVARFAWRIRMAIGSPVSIQLITLLLAPDVRFVPENPTRRRAKQSAEAGYASCRWADANS